MLLFPWEIPGKILNITAQKESVFQKHLQLSTSEVFVVGFVVWFFFSLIVGTTLLFMLNHKNSLSVTPGCSCCVEMAGMLIYILEFYPALSEILFWTLPCFLPVWDTLTFYKGLRRILKQSSQGAVFTSACNSLAVLPTQHMTMAPCSVGPMNSWNIGPTTSMTLLWVWS